MMNLNKKGISPLIATVLVIGFTVALAAVILTWGTSFTKSIQKGTEETTEIQLACAQDVQFDVKSACYDSVANGIKFIVENNGNRDLVKFNARLKVSETDISAGEVPNPTAPNPILPRFGLQTYTLTAADVPGITGKEASVQEVTLVPVIKIGDREITCAQTIESYSPAVADTPLAECQVAPTP